MTIKIKYFLFILLIHGLITYLVYLLLVDRKGLFILSEVLILLSLVLSYQIFIGFIRPLQFMANGIDAIKDEDFSVQYLETNSKELNKLLGVYNEMIQNIRIERVQLQEQHFFLQKLIEVSPLGIVILDFDGKITQMNPKAEEIFEVKESESIGIALTEINHPLINGMLDLESGQSAVISGKGLEKYKCGISDFVHRGFKRQFIQLQELSKEILAAEKRAYGKVIRMMAHEVNNSLGATNSILGTTIDYLGDSKEEDAPLMKEALDTALNRNQSLNLFMRNFADVVRLPEPQLEPIAIKELVRSVGIFMAPVAKEQRVEMEFDLPNEAMNPWWIDKKQIEQVLVNVVKNAIEAIPDSGIIQLIVNSSPRQIIIRNNGNPIPKEIKDKLFSPFFSTKATGQGVGLTLVREIVVNHNAKISLETKADGWTACTIQFTDH